MGASFVRPECGVPLAHYVNVDNGPAVAVGCADLRVASVSGCALVVAAFVVAQSCVFTLPASPDTTPLIQRKKRRPVLPAVWALLPLVLAAAYAAVAPRIALADFAVTRATYESSELSKSDFVQLAAADRRLHTTAAASLASAGIASGSGLISRGLL